MHLLQVDYEEPESQTLLGPDGQPMPRLRLDGVGFTAKLVRG